MPSALLLHGFLGSARNLASFARTWSEREPGRSIVAADLLGHGQAPALPPQPTLRSLVPPIVEQLKTLAEPVRLVGHSLGGRAAVLAAIEQPVERVTMLDIAPGPIGDRNRSVESVVLALVGAPEHAASRADMRRALVDQGLTAALAEWLIMNLV